MGLETNRSEPNTEPGEEKLTIFQDDQVILLGDRVDFLPPFQAERRTSRVLAATVGDSEISMKRKEGAGNSYGTV